MVVDKVGSLLPFSCEQIFDLAADVERYPEFLRWWISAKISKREPNKITVEQVLGFGLVHMTIASKATLRRPRNMEITSADARFREFGLSFTVSPVLPAGCTLRIKARLELRSVFLSQIVNSVLSTSVDEIMAAFEGRAHRVYSGFSHPPGLHQGEERHA